VKLDWLSGHLANSGEATLGHSNGGLIIRFPTLPCHIIKYECEIINETTFLSRLVIVFKYYKML
jgi:hypothetical protein